MISEFQHPFKLLLALPTLILVVYPCHSSSESAVLLT